MNKYDFGYEIVSGSTIEWAFNKVLPQTSVLELGPSNGNLVRHLTEDKKCIADIVELDRNAGEEAAAYCRNSCLGMVEGNLERQEWFEILQDNQYDYIIILDVLEHVRNPLEVLQKVTYLLKTDGQLLVSIPNIAHNSVILGLLKNEFQYTDVGLLDNTHVHFFTYESVLKLLNEAGLATLREEVIQKQVGNNEIENFYGELPKSIDAFLKTRELGTAYQFLFTAKKDIQQKEGLLEYVNDQLYEIVAFNNGNGAVLKKQAINPVHKISFHIDLTHCRVGDLRIDPMNSNCIIKDVSLTGTTDCGLEKKIELREYTGCQLDGLYIFGDDDPQLYFDIPEEVQSLCFECTLVAFDSEDLNYLVGLRSILNRNSKEKALLSQQISIKEQECKNISRELEESRNNTTILTNELKLKQDSISTLNDQIGMDLKQIENLSGCLNQLQGRFDAQSEIVSNLNHEIELKKADIESLNTELEIIHSKFWWKVNSRINNAKERYFRKR